MHPLARPKIDISGQKVGRLLVIEYSASSDGRKAWICDCDCGNRVEVRGVNLRLGKTRSCGCLKSERMSDGIGKTHGMYGSRVNKSWSSMIERCTNEKNVSYKDYGGRGIKVCERWLSFENFYKDMGDRPPGMSLDRIDNKKGYEPGNCKWSTPKEQQNNRRNSRRYIFNGVEYTSLELSEITGIGYHALRKKLSMVGGDVMLAVSKYGISNEYRMIELVMEYESRLRA